MENLQCCKKPPWWARQITKLVDILFMTGSVLAILMSWEKFHSVGYSTFVAFAGWAYVWFPNFYDKAWTG